MRKFTMILSAAALLAASGMVTGCGPAHHHIAKPTKKSVEVYHFADGRYGYRGDDGMWWYYATMSNTSSSYGSGGAGSSFNVGGRSPTVTGGFVPSPTGVPTGPATGSSTPSATSVTPAPSATADVSERGGFGSSAQQFQTGTWAKGNPPTEEDLAAAGPPEQLEMDFGEAGQPLTEQEAQTEEAEAEAPTTEAAEATPSGETETTTAPSESAGESSAPAESAPSSDSGSSGDSGGGGGDGGGGGSD